MNWTIGAMRDINAADPVGGLGPRVTPAPTPAPAPVKRGDGFVVGPDGKLSTDLPDPTVPAVIGGVPVWPFPHMPTAAPDPDQVTNCWRCDTPYLIASPACPMCLATNANVDLDKAHAEMDAHAAPPVALRVGDRVRLLPAAVRSCVRHNAIGSVCVVESVGASAFLAYWALSLRDEGVEWERA